MQATSASPDKASDILPSLLCSAFSLSEVQKIFSQQSCNHNLIIDAIFASMLPQLILIKIVGKIMSHQDLDIAKILSLSRLKASAEEQEKIACSLVQILNWISVMQEVDTDDVEPMLGAIDEMPRRDDVISDGNIAKKILQNAPDQAFGMFGVPKVVE